VAADADQGREVTAPMTPTSLTDLHWLTATEITAAYAARRLSPVELVKALIDRINAHDGRVAAFIKLDAEGALDAARQAEKDLLAGRKRSPLHGVPVAIKDNVDVVGLPTTCHSKIMVGNIAREDAQVVGHLRAAGAILLGKLSLHEFAFGGPWPDLPFPFARNPWNIDCQPGGSSSGSGAALAAGFAPLAIGSDTGGSIRNPAGLCGVVGLKPTYDLVSRHGVFPLSFTLDHVGPMARSVGDVAAFLDVLAGNLPTRRFGVDLDRGARGLRVGFVRHFHETDMVADPEVAAALAEAARVLAKEGAEVREITLPRLQHFASVQRVILLSEAFAVHAKWLRERPGDYATPTLRKVLGGVFLTAGDYVRAQQWRGRMIDAVDNAFRDVDVLLTANGMDFACRFDDAAALARAYPRQARSPFNLTGHPALALPSGLSKSGLPLSLQLVGRAHDETTLLRLAAAYERATTWSTQHPPMERAAARGLAASPA
jgi:aspartyl-tRNA(Asn)/glutamyl-tRNA(Gln) amidotransferase subunit A